MKFSAATLALAAAGLAAAKSVQNTYPREVAVPLEALPQSEEISIEQEKQKENDRQRQQNPAHLPAGLVSGEHVIIIWVNPGGGADRTTMNDQVTVTEFQTVFLPGATPPAAADPHAVPPPPPPPAGGTPTHPDAGAPPPAAPPASGSTHEISVGGPAGLIFSPDQIKANVGDMVVFTFYNANHTATQSTFAEPCKPLAGGMDSGFIPNPENGVNPPPQVAMQVMVPDALWFYCAQGPHCGKGMVFSINPTAERTHAMFQSMAIAQNGKGGATPITGGQPAAPPAEGAAPPPAAPPLEGLPSQSTPPAAGTTGGLAPLPGTGGTGGNGVTEGNGVIEGGACVCSVQCNMGAFPNLAQQGLGAVGGVGGSLPIGQAVRRRW